MTLITAHEGCEGAPSNTTASVRKGIESGADIVEVDVRTTKDNIVILAHSEDIETVSGESFRLRDLDLSDIRKLEKEKRIRFDHPEGKITLIDEAFEIIKGSGVVVNLDVKESESIDSIVKKVREHKILDHVIVTGCEKMTASYFKSGHPEFQVLLNTSSDLMNFALTDRRIASEMLYKDAILSGCCGINVPYKFCFPELVNYMHRRFLPVSVWTIDSEEDMRKYIKMGVYSITTKKPKLLKKIIDSN